MGETRMWEDLEKEEEKEEEELGAKHPPSPDYSGQQEVTPEGGVETTQKEKNAVSRKEREDVLHNQKTGKLG